MKTQKSKLKKKIRRPSPSSGLKRMRVKGQPERGRTKGINTDRHEYFKTLIENSADALVCVDQDRKVVYFNPSAARILGYGFEELSELIGLGIVHPDDSDRLLNEVDSVFDGKHQEILCRCRVRHKDSSWRTLELRVRNFMEDSAVRAIVLSGRDVTEQKLAEDALQESEARYRSLVELSPEAIAIHEDERFVYINPAGAKLIGAKDPSELVGRSVFDVIHPDYHNLVRTRLQHVVVNGIQSPPIEEKLLTLDGKTIDAEVVSIPVSFRGRHAVQSVVRDLTDRKKWETTLQHRDAILEAVGDAAEQFLKSGSWQDSIQEVLKWLGTILDVGWVTIFEKTITAVQHTVVRMRDEWVGQGVASHKGDPLLRNLDVSQYGFDRWLTSMDKGNIVRGLVKGMPEKDRTLFERFGVVSLAAVPIPVGSVMWGFMIFADCRRERTWSDAEVYALKFAADILGAAIERQQYEFALKSSEQKYRMLFEESRDAVYISTPEGKFVDINLAGIQMLGYRTEEEVLALDIERDLYFDQTERAIFQRAIEQQGFVKDFELSVKRADGQKLTVVETASAVRNSEGRIVMYRGIFRDVTKQRELEQNLLQVQKMESLGTLAAGIAHDFNNILSIILVYNSLVQKIANDPQKLAQSSAAIHKAVERGASLVKQILTFARKTEVHVGPIEVNGVIKEVARMVDETFPKTINLDVQLKDGLPFITADQTQFQQVLLNLCVNARDAMPTGGTLTVKTDLSSGRSVHALFSEATASEYAHVSIRDTGVGMDEGTRSHIFDPFFTTKQKGKGTGLGLSVVYGAVKNHNGFVRADSEPGRGSTFHLYFPIPTKAPRPFNLEKGEEKEIPGGSETILLVEDEEAIRSNIQALFEAKGYRVLTARDGGTAVELYKEKKDDIHLVLSDLGLPTLSGDQVLFLLKAVDPSVKVIFASGYFEPETKNELANAGALDFVQKPYTPEEILRKVRKALDRP